MTSTVADERTAVVVGSGLAGLSTAISLADRGIEVEVLESTEKIGGAAAFSGGQVWIAANHVALGHGLDDSQAAGAEYIEALNADAPEYLDRQLMQRWLELAPRAARYFEAAGAARWEMLEGYADYYQEAPGSRPEGRYLTSTFASADLGPDARHLRISPHFPMGTTYSQLFADGHRASAFGADAGATSSGPEVDLTFGTGVVAGFLAAALRRGVRIRRESPAVELISRGGSVVGVVTEDRAGRRSEHHGPVVLATSGFDWNPELIGEYLGLGAGEFGSVAPRSLVGDGLRLAQSAGAAVTAFPPARSPMLPGYRDDREPGFAVLREHSLPHTFIVDGSARRFADDSVYWEINKAVLDPDHRRLPIWAVWDEQHHRKYGMGSTQPGAAYRSPDVVSAPTLAALGRQLGIDGDQLEGTALRFNDGARRGEDPDFGRGTNMAWRRFVGDPNQEPNELLGTVEEPPFFALPLRILSTGINLTGIATDADARACDQDGEPVPGLYAVGACAAFATSGIGYNSGFSLSRAISFGLAAAESIAGDVRIAAAQAEGR